MLPLQSPTRIEIAGLVIGFAGVVGRWPAQQAGGGR